MDRLSSFVRALHRENANAGRRIAVAITGGGVRAPSVLLGTPGGSSSIVEVQVPYARGALAELLGSEPAQFCSQQTALDIARAAHRRARALVAAEAGLVTSSDSPPEGVDPTVASDRHVIQALSAPCVGVGCTAALVSDRPKRGEHRAHVAACADDRTVLLDLTLAKDARSRWEEDELVSACVVAALARACEVDVPASVVGDLLIREESGSTVRPVDELIEEIRVEESSPLQRLLSDADEDVKVVAVLPRPSAGGAGGAGDAASAAGQIEVASPIVPPRTLVFSGSFNPLHVGHVALAHAAQKSMGEGTEAPPALLFELPISNADKGVLPAETVRERLAQFAPGGQYKEADGTTSSTLEHGAGVLVTRCPLFSQKSEVMRGVTFVVGFDTAVRIVNPKYYGGMRGLVHALKELDDRGCSFLVAGRVDESDGTPAFKTLEDMSDSIPIGFESMFRGIPVDLFRHDVSSTEIRATI